MKFEDIARAAQMSAQVSKYRKTPNEKLTNIVDFIFDKIIELMSKDNKKNVIEKSIIVRGAQNLKPSTKKYIMLDMSTEDAKDLIEKAKREIESD